jgi:hypothetical protein
MENEKNSKKYLWIYAVVLFASAFTVLLLTALSQVKITKNMEALKKQQKENESSMQGVSFSLNTATMEKKTLKQKADALEKENISLRAIAATADQAIQAAQRSKESFDYLLEAEKLYKDDEYVKSANLLSKVNPVDLGEIATKKYLKVKSEVYPYTARRYFKAGKFELEAKSYKAAKEDFELAHLFDTINYFEENILYYLANASNKLGEAEKFNSYKTELKNKYPDSEYLKRLE